MASLSYIALSTSRARATLSSGPSICSSFPRAAMNTPRRFFDLDEIGIELSEKRAEQALVVETDIDLSAAHFALR